MVRETEISWIDAAKLGIFCAFVGFIVFMIIEVIWAQIIKDTIIAQYESGLLILIILAGFLLSIVISLVSAMFISRMISKKYVFYAALFAFSLNINFWIILSYSQILIYYPEILENLTGFEKIVAIPRILAYFAIYRLTSVAQLWAFSQFTFAFFFVLLLKIMKAKKLASGYNYDLKI